MDRPAEGFKTCLFSAAVLAVIAAPLVADVDLDLIPVESVVNVGDTVKVQVVMTSTTGQNKLVSAVDMIFEWDPQKLLLLGLTQDGAVNLLVSGFPADPCGINEATPPQNGLGLYTAWAHLGNPVAATPDGTLLTTLLFEALEPAQPTTIEILLQVGNCKTKVFDGTVPNTNILNDIFGTEVTIINDCPADLDGNGTVGVGDLLTLLAAWGQCPPPGEGACPADLNHDGVVGVGDLLVLLSQWGPCP